LFAIFSKRSFEERRPKGVNPVFKALCSPKL